MAFEVTLKFIVAAPDKFMAELYASTAAEMLYASRHVFRGVGLVTDSVEEKVVEPPKEGTDGG